MSSDYFEAIQERLAAVDLDGLTVARWRITWREYESLAAGARDNALLGVYTPLRQDAGRSGSWLLEWSDGQISRGNLDGSSLANLDELLAASAAARREDPDAANFLGPTETDHVPLHYARVADLFEKDPEPAADLARMLLDHGAELGARNVTVGVSAGRGTGGVATSEGLALEDPYTAFSFYIWLDGELGDGFGSRGLFEPVEVEQRLEGLDALWNASREDAAWGDARETWLVLHPHTVESFLDHFVLSNLAGSAVVHGQSRWDAGDFAAATEVARGDLTLRVEPRVPHHIGSFNFTGEGVPTEPTAYIRDGRLAEPILDLKHARKLDRRPTTPPKAGESMRLDLAEDQAWDDWLAGVDEGVLVTSVLGMHTQDSARGDYSLAVPTGIRIRDGKLDAKCRVTLSGNHFEDLGNETLRALRLPHLDLPALALRATVSPDKG